MLNKEMTEEHLQDVEKKRYFKEWGTYRTCT